MCIAPLATPDGATPSRGVMILFVAIAIIVVIVLAALAGYAIGARGGGGNAMSAQTHTPASAPALAAAAATASSADERAEMQRVGIEKARIIRSRDAEAATLRRSLSDRDAHAEDDAGLKRECERLNAALANARTESARYRQLVVDIEKHAPPAILSGAGEPDDLKLIVGIGPVLERMLHN